MRSNQSRRGEAMPARPPRRGLKEPLGPPAGEQPTAQAELHVIKLASEEQVTPAPNPPNRIVNMLRRAGLGAVLPNRRPFG